MTSYERDKQHDIIDRLYTYLTNQHEDHTKNEDISHVPLPELQYNDPRQTLYDINCGFKTESLCSLLNNFCNKEKDDEVFYYHPDHLGGAAWITDMSGKPVQYLHYAPYGELVANQMPYGIDERFKFTGKERDAETGYDNFEARPYISAFSIFGKVDPLSDKNIHENPYFYCSGSPTNRIDPTGLDDIFDISGQFIEHIDNETDYVLIRNNGKLTNITEFSYDKREIGNRTMLKNVLTHYANQVGIFQNISLSDDPKDGEGATMSTKTSTGVVSGVINHGTLNSNASTASNIINSASHEFFHFLTRTSGPMAELEAISFQMSHDSWTKTTEDFKAGITNYAMINANKALEQNGILSINPYIYYISQMSPFFIYFLMDNTILDFESWKFQLNPNYLWKNIHYHFY